MCTAMLLRSRARGSNMKGSRKGSASSASICVMGTVGLPGPWVESSSEHVAEKCSDVTAASSESFVGGLYGLFVPSMFQRRIVPV